LAIQHSLHLRCRIARPHSPQKSMQGHNMGHPGNEQPHLRPDPV
jgi:hypothetical protein